MRVLFIVLLLIVTAGMALAEQNASNPLASVNNLDFKWQYVTTKDSVDRHDVFLDGALMLHPKLKFKYELHYNFTDATGSDESGFEKLVFKPIFFPTQAKLNDTWGMKTAVGLDWIIEFNNSEAKGIGVGADQLGPFVGLAFSHFQSKLVLIPLLQHFVSYRSSGSDRDINTTAMRLIALLPFGEGYWAKLDAKVPYDWENEKWVSTAEIQVGYNINQTVALFVDGLVGIGKDRPIDGGVALGLRFKY